MKKKRGKILEVLNSKLFIGAFIFIILGLAMVIAGNVAVEEGNMYLEGIITINNSEKVCTAENELCNEGGSDGTGGWIDTSSETNTSLDVNIHGNLRVVGGNQTELPHNQEDGWANMTNNILLMHMNNNWGDASGEGNNGISVGGATFTTASKLGGYAGSFDGVNDLVNITDGSDFDVTTGDITIAAWVKTNSSTNQPIFKHLDGSAVGYYFRIRNSDVLAFYPNDGVNNELIAGTQTGILDNEWHHVAAVWDGTKDNVTFYIDGNGEEVAATNSYGSLSATAPAEIGENAASGMWFNGTIDELAVWNRILSSSEISNIYNTQSPTYSGYGGAIAVGDNSLDGLSPGDVNLATLYYDILSAKSPSVHFTPEDEPFVQCYRALNGDKTDWVIEWTEYEPSIWQKIGDLIGIEIEHRDYVKKIEKTSKIGESESIYKHALKCIEKVETEEGRRSIKE